MTRPAFTTVHDVLAELDTLQALHDAEDQAHAQAAARAVETTSATQVPGWEGDDVDG